MAEHTRLAAALRKEAARLGFAALGVCSAEAVPQAGVRLRQWLAEGCHGEMIWMEGRADERASPRGLWPAVERVIMLGTSYAPALDPLRLAGVGDTGVISVYAWNRDYHDLIKKRLKALARWLVAEAGGDVKVFVDTAPVMEKPLAAAAGLGWQGKHSNLVSREHGSWLFLGAIYTTLDLPADAPHVDRCGSCTRCQTACPTDAFPAPYRLDARRCLAYLTIENAGPIPLEFRAPMANRIYGCDDCLSVCPWNRFAQASEEPAFLPRAELTAPKLADLLALDDAAFRALFSGSAIKRIGVKRFIRNCLYAAGNSGDVALLPAVHAHLGSDDAVVADAAAWATAQLEGTA
ncbi:tRNA epoxyqueuosine(34) reductase QueG [Sandarakinorhabdus sp.]|uniref:tRNA epoxyqueuosine(34) reductase QueG n=1 Tax=Sandarakinorhabdus sp. TaxID=1916663 RepID=UPI003340DEE6